MSAVAIVERELESEPIAVDIAKPHDDGRERFDAVQRAAMLQDDLLAGKTVSAVLVAVIALGLVAMLVTVAICW